MSTTTRELPKLTTFRRMRNRVFACGAALLFAVSTSGAGGLAIGHAQGAAQCGLGNGQKATGAPIKLGAIVTKQPGTDFTGITGMAQAYFNCVNDNGGINGRPIQYVVEEEQTNPQQVAALAAKLIQDEQVLAIVGSTSLIDCTVNHAF